MAIPNVGFVYEGSVGYLTVKFYDKSNNLAAPASATWEVHDRESGSVLLAPTAIAPIASSVELTLTPTINALVNPLNEGDEQRIVTIKATWGVGNITNAEVEYDIRNLSYVG